MNLNFFYGTMLEQFNILSKAIEYNNIKLILMFALFSENFQSLLIGLFK